MNPMVVPVIILGVITGAIVLWILLGGRPRNARPAPAVVEQRRARFPGGPPSPGTCPICGLDDPDHLQASWRTWPVHPDCLDWLPVPPIIDAGWPPRRAIAGVTTAEATAAIGAMFGTTAADPPGVDVTTVADPAPVYLTARLPAVPAAGSPEFRTWFDALPKPAGWDTVQPDDDCDCPRPGRHVQPCIYARPVPPLGPGAATTAR